MAVREPIQASTPRDPRSDSEPTRERLLLAALRLFSQQGYARTSVRGIQEIRHDENQPAAIDGRARPGRGEGT
ncbi:MAG: TetR family transcriptional regulator, partial [Alicycliphilus sp.]